MACWAWSPRCQLLLLLQLWLLPLQLRLTPPLLGSGSQICLQQAQQKLLLSLLIAQWMRGRAVPP